MISTWRTIGGYEFRSIVINIGKVSPDTYAHLPQKLHQNHGEGDTNAHNN